MAYISVHKCIRKQIFAAQMHAILEKFLFQCKYWLHQVNIALSGSTEMTWRVKIEIIKWTVESNGLNEKKFIWNSRMNSHFSRNGVMLKQEIRVPITVTKTENCAQKGSRNGIKLNKINIQKSNATAFAGWQLFCVVAFAQNGKFVELTK